MTSYYFSAKILGFYASSLKENYESTGTLPDDAVELTDEMVSEFIRPAPDGKQLSSDSDGLPTWENIPPLTNEEIATANEVKKSFLRAVADDEIAWRQDAVDAGIATDEETAALAEWKKYRVLLMRVDTTAPEWPTPPTAQV